MFGKKTTNFSELAEVNKKIDFTLLDARATLADLEKLCDAAYKNQYYSVCVNPCNVEYVSGYIKRNFDDALRVCVVVGFPLGANTAEVKVLETKKAIQDGADEIDVVVNIGRVKNGDFSYVKNELSKIKKTAKNRIVKAIIETCYLDENEIVKVCKACMKSGVDFVKTSTGFGTGGAVPEIVSLIKRTVGDKCMVKASGGIRTREQAIELINLGADRIGTSRVL